MVEFARKGPSCEGCSRDADCNGRAAPGRTVSCGTGTAAELAAAAVVKIMEHPKSMEVTIPAIRSICQARLQEVPSLAVMESLINTYMAGMARALEMILNGELDLGVVRADRKKPGPQPNPAEQV